MSLSQPLELLVVSFKASKQTGSLQKFVKHAKSTFLIESEHHCS